MAKKSSTFSPWRSKPISKQRHCATCSFPILHVAAISPTWCSGTAQQYSKGHRLRRLRAVRRESFERRIAIGGGEVLVYEPGKTQNRTQPPPPARHYPVTP